MWGHRGGCPCVICITLPRVCELIAVNSGLQGFLNTAGSRLRVLETELRDDVTRLGGQQQGSSLAPNTGTSASAAAGVPDPQGQALPATAAHETSGQGGHHFPAPRTKLDLKAKAVPPPPPPSLSSVSVKQEPKEGSPSISKGPLADVEESVEEEARERERSRERKDRRSRKERKAEEKASKKRDRRSRTPRREKATKSPETRGDTRSPSPRGKERKSREGRATSSGRSPISRKDSVGSPRPPNYPPPGRVSERGEDRAGPSSRPAQGPGWRGPLPFSSHPRWLRGKNKGVVKRAKQERHQQRRREGRGGRWLKHASQVETPWCSRR